MDLVLSFLPDSVGGALESRVERCRMGPPDCRPRCFQRSARHPIRPVGQIRKSAATETHKEKESEREREREREGAMGDATVTGSAARIGPARSIDASAQRERADQKDSDRPISVLFPPLLFFFCFTCRS